MTKSKKSNFQSLYEIDCSKNVEAKGKFNYLSWAHAWRWLKERHPDATYTIYKNVEGWNYHTDGRTAWVECGVTVDGLEHVEHLPILNFQNKAQKLETVDSMAVNTAIKRCVTKAIGLHGMGLYLYEGEDLPDLPTWDADNPDMRGNYIAQIKVACDNKDDIATVEAYRDLTASQQKDVWRDFNPEEKSFIKSSCRDAAERKYN
jgi:hypothetical protein|tara:strand:- start:711 stop:1322 length:612 start_codon:yes stop_codon:yes gene_type:complete